MCDIWRLGFWCICWHGMFLVLFVRFFFSVACVPLADFCFFFFMSLSLYFLLEGPTGFSLSVALSFLLAKRRRRHRVFASGCSQP